MSGVGVVKHVGIADFHWTEDRVALLRARWANGKTSQQISDELGCGSRSAVIGKVHRLRLPARREGYSVSVATNSNLPIRVPKVTRPKAAPGKDRGLKAKIARRQDDDGNGFEVLPIPDQAADRLIPAAQRKTLLELTSETCRWPVGDPRDADFFFCGGKSSSDGGPYCNGHARAAFAGAGKGRDPRPYQGRAQF